MEDIPSYEANQMEEEDEEDSPKTVPQSHSKKSDRDKSEREYVLRWPHPSGTGKLISSG